MMQPRQARQILIARRPSGADDASPAMKEALETAAQTPDLQADLDAQGAFDLMAAAEILSEVELTDAAREQCAEAGGALAAHSHGRQVILSRPAIAAVGVGFLLTVAVVVWAVLGRAGAFPDDAVKIATQGMKASQESFEPVETSVGDLGDWFLLKNFDKFQVPAELDGLKTAGVRIFKYENEPIAMVLTQNRLALFAFNPIPFGINVMPEKKWLLTEADRTALAIRQENGVCFMVWYRGSKADLDRILRNPTATTPVSL